jgi:hypothetical protein
MPTDVHIPSFPARTKNATLRDHITLLKDNFLNTLKNISRCDSLSLPCHAPPFLDDYHYSTSSCFCATPLRRAASALLFPKESDELTVFSMRKLAQENAFPGRDISSARSFQIFQAKSTEDSAWVAPLRSTLLENYKRVNNAIAE